jgi:hypothetical protein
MGSKGRRRTSLRKLKSAFAFRLRSAQPRQQDRNARGSEASLREETHHEPNAQCDRNGGCTLSTAAQAQYSNGTVKSGVLTEMSGLRCRSFSFAEKRRLPADQRMKHRVLKGG